MKVLLINGSPRREGNTFIALSEAARALEAEGVGAEIVSIGTKAVQGCIACGKCAELGRCVFNDALYNEVREKLAGADALVVGSPVYYAGPNGSLCALLDRLFYSCGELLAYKPAAGGGRMPPGRGERDVRPAEQVFHDFKHARRVVAILEQRPREAAGRGGAGRRRVADDARAGPQHGADAPGRTAGFGRPSRTGRAGRDEFYPLKGPSAGRMNGKRAPLFAESGNIVYFWGTFRKDAGVVELARLESE